MRDRAVPLKDIEGALHELKRGKKIIKMFMNPKITVRIINNKQGRGSIRFGG